MYQSASFIGQAVFNRGEIFLIMRYADMFEHAHRDHGAERFLNVSIILQPERDFVLQACRFDARFAKRQLFV